MFRQLCARSSGVRSARLSSWQVRENAAATRGAAWARFFASKPWICYTWTDEAPSLATCSLLPVVEAFTRPAGVAVETRDISLASRVLAAFGKEHDALAELGALCAKPEANIIKLPNVSASLPQLKATIAELQAKGHDLPNYPDDAKTDAERETARRYATAMGSAVNPVLRLGNSDRRAPKAVKDFVRANPPPNKPWTSAIRTHVASMSDGDFFGNEQSITNGAAPRTVRIEHVAAADGAVTVLKAKLALEPAEVLDSTFMSASKLARFLDEQVADAKASGMLFSLHLKATMMKVSDPIIFGHAVRAFFKPAFEKHAAALERLGVNANNGLGAVLERVATLPDAERDAIKADFAACYETGPALAQVDSSRGITNLHVPSDVIIDASMPNVVRDAGCMWNAKDELQETKCVIPDRCYGDVYQVMFDDCRANGQFDATKLGSVSNVGLMAFKAEEYGSHDKTFQVASNGTVRIVDADNGEVLMQHECEAGDIWRACQAKDAAIRDWVKLAVTRARASGSPAIFWLNKERAHDAQLIAKVESYLKEHDTNGLDIRILAPADAAKFSVDRLRAGQDTISVTGNVLRDYLTDLFPIIEVGTSARMLSIVPLLNGGGLFETGAGGSAPKHVQQFLKENHLRWDSLGEYMALASSFEHIADRFGNEKAGVIAKALDAATSKFLLNAKSPSRKCGEIDNRGSTFYVALYWARALADQTSDAELAATFKPVAEALEANEAKINEELLAVQGSPVNIGGYYAFDRAQASAAMRPSATLNSIIDAIGK